MNYRIQYLHRDELILLPILLGWYALSMSSVLYLACPIFFGSSVVGNILFFHHKSNEFLSLENLPTCLIQLLQGTVCEDLPSLRPTQLHLFRQKFCRLCKEYILNFFDKTKIDLESFV